MRALGSIVSALALFGFVTASCGSGQGSGAACAQGQVRCPCYPNGTCNVGLTCASGLCVSVDTTGASASLDSAGAGSSSGGGGDSSSTGDGSAAMASAGASGQSTAGNGASASTAGSPTTSVGASASSGGASSVSSGSVSASSATSVMTMSSSATSSSAMSSSSASGGCASGATEFDEVAMTPECSSPDFDTTGAVCVKVMGSIPNGWECANGAGRTVTVIGATTTMISGADCMNTQPPMTAGADGYVYFNFSAGGVTYTSFTCF